jgi:hypothetical protein
MRKIEIRETRKRRTNYPNIANVRIKRGVLGNFKCLRIYFYERAIMELGLKPDEEHRRLDFLMEDDGRFVIFPNKDGQLATIKMTSNCYHLTSVALYNKWKIPDGDYELVKWKFDTFILKPLKLN